MQKNLATPRVSMLREATVDYPGCYGPTEMAYLRSGGPLTTLADGGTVPAAIDRNLALNNQGQVAFMSQTEPVGKVPGSLPAPYQPPYQPDHRPMNGR
jgi:hypothetical protein